MYLSRLVLDNFRSHIHLDIKLSPEVNIIMGTNGSGKTNILEAVYFLSSGKSFRSSTVSQLPSWGQKITSVRGLVHTDNLENKAEAQLVHADTGSSLSRRFLINQVVKTRPKYLGTLRTVVFDPEDIRLVSGSPNRRREYLDSIFLQTEWRYAQALSQFKKALVHRNELLDLIRLGKSQISELFYWNQSLVKNDRIIHDFRHSFIKSANTFFQNHPNKEISSISLEYHPSLLTQEKLDNNYQYELAAGHTLFGSHRDDFSFNQSIFPSPDQNLAHWGSRGQQRLAVLSLRLAQIDFIESLYQDPPILLLDDIFSELDSDHKQLVYKLCLKYQSIITSADDLSHEFSPSALVFNLPTAQNAKV